MAEIHVEKKRTNIWPWIIGLVLVILLVLGIAAMMNRNREAARTSALTAPALVEVVAAAPLALAA